MSTLIEPQGFASTMNAKPLTHHVVFMQLDALLTKYSEKGNVAEDWGHSTRLGLDFGFIIIESWSDRWACHVHPLASFSVILCSVARKRLHLPPSHSRRYGLPPNPFISLPLYNKRCCEFPSLIYAAHLSEINKKKRSAFITGTKRYGLPPNPFISLPLYNKRCCEFPSLIYAAHLSEIKIKI